MGDCSRNREVYPLFLDSISNEREWLVRGDQVSFGVSEDKKLELRLGLPGDELVDIGNSKDESRERDESLLSLGCYSSMASKTDNNNSNNNNSAGAKRGFLDTVEAKAGDDTWLINHKGYQNQKLSSSDKPVGKIFSSPWSSCSSPSPSSSVFQMKIHHQQQQPKPSFLQFPSIPQSLPVTAKECSQTCITKVELQNPEKKACSPASPNATVPNSSQKRNASAPVVGWPPIRSFRKNIGSSSSLKPAPELRSLVPTEVTGEKSEGCPKGLFVKINMDGVPIGRKVDLNAHNSYEKLSFAVDKLFRDLLAAQNNSSAAGNQNKEESKAITGLLDGSGEYTLVYEDNEGDRMLVGDVPWHMFVSAVKRLRVLKSSELSALCFGGNKQGRTPPDHGVK